MSNEDTKKFLEECELNSMSSDPFEFEDPAIQALDATKIMNGGCTPAPTCGNGGTGTDTVAAATAGGGLVF